MPLLTLQKQSTSDPVHPADPVIRSNVRTRPGIVAGIMTLPHWLVDALGLVNSETHLLAVTLRTVVAYLVVLTLVRVGQRRFRGEYGSAFDMIVGISLGALLASAIDTAEFNFLDLLWAILVLVVLHYALGKAAGRMDWFRKLIRSPTRCLYQDGEFQIAELRRYDLTEEDLHLALRSNLQTDDWDGIEAAYIETSGDISFVKAEAGSGRSNAKAPRRQDAKQEEDS